MQLSQITQIALIRESFCVIRAICEQGLFCGSLPVVDADPGDVDCHILRFAIEVRIDVVDELAVDLALGFVEGHDQRRQQDKIGKHGDDERSGREQTECHCSTEVGESKNDEACEKNDRRVNDALTGFENTLANGSRHKETCRHQLLSVLRKETNGVVDRDTECNTEDQRRTCLQRYVEITHQSCSDHQRDQVGDE